MADDDYAYLSGLSAHPGRAGDTTNFNPRFAASLAGALRQANAAGLDVGLESGFRQPGQTGSAYDAGGNSSHTYGLAADINGLDGPNGRLTNLWAQIAQANGLHNPYGVGDSAEFNHWQLPPQPLEQNPELLAQLKAAKASGNMSAVWNAYNGAGGSAAPTAQGTTIHTSGPDFYATAMQHESGGKNIPNAAGGWKAAGGYYQFTPPTYAGIRAAHPELNLPENIQNATQDQQTAAYHQLVSQNVQALQGANLPVNDKNVFMGSFLGGSGATKFLSAMNQNPGNSAAALFPTEAQANPTVFYNNGKARSLQQVYDLQTGSFGSGNTTGFGPNAAPASSGPVDPSIIARGGTSPPLPTGAPAAPAVASATPQPFNWATQMQPAAKGQAPTLADNLNKMLGKGQGQGQGGDQGETRAPAFNLQPPFVHREDPSTAYMNYGTTLNSLGAQMPPRSPLTGNPMGASSGGVLSPGLPGYQPIGAQLSGISPYAMMQFGPGALGMQSGGINVGPGQQQDLYALMGAGG